ncbi:MAG TPA: primosomal protein, partial [Nakamurella sp.]|nr:primosomal protein [Nakamurella sp.]
ATDLLAGPEEVDRDQLTLGVELLVDAATARADSETVEALGSSTPLGNLVSIIIKPDPARMTPSPPFDDEAAAWSILVDRFVSTLDWDGERP